jgi:hypothetical protein
MMTQTKRNSKSGDAAVDGLVGGLAGGVVMALFLVITGLVGSEGPGDVLGRFAPAGDANPLTGALSHLAVSAIYGAVFGVLTLPLRGRVPGWLAGLVYGLALYGVAQIIISGAGAALRGFAPVNFALAHVIYGAVLGWRVARNAV